MTTNTYSAPCTIANDTEFRAWGSAFSAALTAVGFPKAADTGQIDWATVAKPGASSTSAGYEIRYLNDSLHATKPCYVKIEFGTGGTSTTPSIWITVASGTNGAGTVSGTTYFARTQHAGNGAPNVGSYPTFVCATEGYIACAMQRRGQLSSHPFWSVARTVDSAGAPTSDGFIVMSAPSSSFARTTYLSSSFSDGTGFCLIPGNISTTLVSGDVQVFRHFGFITSGAVVCIPHYLSYLDSEIGNESTFTATPVGSTAITYLALGGSFSQASVTAQTLSAARLAMRWE